MKKIIFGLFAVAALCMTSCKENVDIVEPGTQTNPEREVAGTYTGTWTRINTTDETQEEQDGTVTLTAGDAAYVGSVTVTIPAYSMNSSSVMNVNPTGQFYNNVVSDNNGLETAFYGKVTGSDCTMSFRKTERDGRKTTTFQYNFVGRK